MKRKEFNELKNKSLNEFKKIFLEFKEKMINLKFDLRLGKVKNVSEIRKLKKSIAQVLTLIRLKEKQENK